MGLMLNNGRLTDVHPSVPKWFHKASYFAKDKALYVPSHPNMHEASSNIFVLNLLEQNELVMNKR